MKSKIIVSILIACAAPALVHAAEPEDRALLKQCESAKGQVEKECKKVAKEMINNPQPQERTDMTGQDVTHSSPAMDTDAKPAKQPAAKPTPPKQADKKPDSKEPKPQ